MRGLVALGLWSMVAAALALAAGAARAQNDDDQPKRPAIVVGGEATVRAAPDRAFVTVAVESRDKDPAEAQQDTRKSMEAVRKKLAAAGVAGEQIRTVAYDLQLEYEFIDGRRVPREYVSRDALEIRLDDVARVGPVIDAAVGSGATTVSGVRFDLKERDALEREALRDAVADARARADAAAAGAGVKVVSVLRVEEQRGFEPPRPMPMMMKTASAEAAPDTTISAGEIELRAQVTLTVAIE